VIPNGVNLQDFLVISHIKEQKYFKILFVWRYEWTKWIDILIEAVNIIDREILDTYLIQIHLVWYWYDEEKYMNLVKQYNLEKYIIFRWKIVGQKLIQEYSSSHLFILPSRTEGFGMTIIESMASKTLVLATKCWGPEDIIDDWIHWFLVEKENPTALKNKLEEILFLDTKKIDILTEKAYQRVVDKYTWDKVSAHINTIYNLYGEEKHEKK
jgi:glycosyltransferase involved in cell wall biosynthesis